MPKFNEPNAVWIWVQSWMPGGVVGALILLVIGWIVARVLQAVVTGLGRRPGLDRRPAPAVRNVPTAPAPATDTASLIGRIVFWLVMLFVLVGVFDALGLQQVTAPLNDLLTRIFA